MIKKYALDLSIIIFVSLMFPGYARVPRPEEMKAPSVIPAIDQNILEITVGPTSGVRGVKVLTVAPGRPCESVLKPGDTIFAFDLIGQDGSRAGSAKVNSKNFELEVLKIQPRMTVKLLVSLRPVVEVSCAIPEKKDYCAEGRNSTGDASHRFSLKSSVRTPRSRSLNLKKTGALLVQVNFSCALTERRNPMIVEANSGLAGVVMWSAPSMTFSSLRPKSARRAATRIFRFSDSCDP